MAGYLSRKGQQAYGRRAKKIGTFWIRFLDCYPADPPADCPEDCLEGFKNMWRERSCPEGTPLALEEELARLREEYREAIICNSTAVWTFLSISVD